MPDIKTREVIKGTVKTLDRAAVSGERMKDAYVKTKDKAERSVYSSESSPSEYASDRMTGAAEATGVEAVHQFDRQGRRSFEATRENIANGRERWEQCREEKVKKAQEVPKTETSQAAKSGQRSQTPKSKDPARARSSGPTSREQARRYAQKQAEKQMQKKTAQRSAETIRQPVRSVKTAEHGAITVKQAAGSTGRATVKTAKGSVKTAQKTIKTAEQTTRTTVRTAQATAKAAQKTAQTTAKAARAAAQTARATARAAVVTAKAVAKATAAAVKAIIAGTKALVSAIIAGGWVAVVVIVIVCMVGLIAGSCFGIFFSGEDTGTGQTMQTVVQEINADYENRLETIKAGMDYDVLEMSGSRAVWPEVLSVYAVRTTTDPDSARDVATVDDSRKAILKDIFWQMNEIAYRTETTTETVIEETDDGNGNIVETEVTVTQTCLYITVSHKTAGEMADEFGFDADQRAHLGELLADENSSLWAAVLYGIYSGDEQIVAVALSQVGNIGGEPYWSWYGFESRVEWCACFVSWCANECGYIETGVMPKFAGCVNGVQWFRQRSQWADNSIEPAPGMIIFFDWDSPDGSSGPQDGSADHVGIVEKVENGIIYTIEGNSGDSCRQRQYSVGYYEILGYGILNP